MDMGAWVGLIGGAVTAIITVVFVLVTTIISMVLPIGLVFFIFRTFAKQAAAERELLATGTPAPATITAVSQTGSYLNNNPQVRITLEVAPPEGALYTVQLTKFLQLVQIPQVQPGKIVDVRIDPKNPQRVAIVGL